MPLLTQRETAKLLNDISVRSLERWRVAGVGPRYIKVGRQVRYDEQDIQAWLDERRRVSTSAAVVNDTAAEPARAVAGGRS